MRSRRVSNSPFIPRVHPNAVKANISDQVVDIDAEQAKEIFGSRGEGLGVLGVFACASTDHDQSKTSSSGTCNSQHWTLPVLHGEPSVLRAGVAAARQARARVTKAKRILRRSVKSSDGTGCCTRRAA